MSKKKDKPKPEEKKEEQGPKPGCFYIEAADMETGKPIVMELELKIPTLIRDLTDTLKKYGDSFGKQIIHVSTYVTEADPESKQVVLKKVPVAEGPPAAVIKQLEDMCMSKGELANQIMHVLGAMAKSSGLRAVAITYLVEDGEDVLTGGNTMLFTDREEFSDQEASQLYNSVVAHADELKDMLEKDGHKIDDQDGPKLFTPGDVGFTMPPPKKG